MGAALDYAKAFKTLDLNAVNQDLRALMTDSSKLTDSSANSAKLGRLIHIRAAIQNSVGLRNSRDVTN
jgi:catalase (peroxidase I)